MNNQYLSRLIQDRRLILPLVLAIYLLSLVACQQQEQGKPFEQKDLAQHPIYSQYDFSDDENVIHIGVQPLWITTNIIIEAIKHDAILQENLNALGVSIRFHPFFKGSDINFFLKRGDLDAGVGGDMPALLAAATGNIQVTSMIQQGFVSIVAKNQMLLTDMKGKRIAYAFGSNAHFALLNALSAIDVDSSELKMVSSDVSDMLKMFKEDKIELFSAWEPIPSIALFKYDGKVIYRSLSTGYLYFSREYISQHQKITREIIASQIRSMIWLKANRQNLYTASDWAIISWNKFNTDKIPLSVQQVAALAREDILQFSATPIIPKKLINHNGMLHKEFKFLKDRGEINQTLLWTEVKSSFSNTIIDDIMSYPSQYSIEKYRTSQTVKAL